MLNRGFLILIGVLVLSGFLALSVAAYVVRPFELPPPDVDLLANMAPESLVTYQDQMDSWAASGKGKVWDEYESAKTLHHDFDGDGRWDLERRDVDGDQLFEEVTYDIDDDCQADYLRVDADGSGSFEVDEIYRRIENSWMRDTTALASLIVLDEQLAAEPNAAHKSGSETSCDFNGDRWPEVVEQDTDGNGCPESRRYDVDGDGQIEYLLTDTNHDGQFSRDELFANIDGTYRTVYSERPLAMRVDRGPLVKELARLWSWVRALRAEGPQKATIELTDGAQATLEKYDLDANGFSDAWLADVNEDGEFETLLFDLSGDRRADYAWRDSNSNQVIDEAELLEYGSVQGWRPLFPDVLPFPMPFPALYLP